MVILLYNCSGSNAGSIAKTEEEKMIINQIIQECSNQQLEIVWGTKLNILNRDEKDYWTGKLIKMRTGYLSAEVKPTSNFNKESYLVPGKKTKADIFFMCMFGEEDGKKISPNILIEVVFNDDPKRKEKRRKNIGEFKKIKLEDIFKEYAGR